MDTSDLQAFVRRVPFFAILDEAERAELTEKTQLRSLRAGELAFKQGDPGAEFYVVYSGRVRILLEERDREVNLGVVNRGDHFGETALITGQARNATARAAEDTILIALTRESFEEFLFSKPQIREQFDKFIRSASINHFLESCTQLSSVPAKQLQDLIGHLESEFFKEGDVVVRQGTAADKFYLVEKGKLRVEEWQESDREIINFLREGDFFGEKALIEDTPRTADVTCLTDCQLFSLTREAFDRLVTESPKLRTVILDRIQSYLSEKPPIPYEEIIRQELAAEKRVTLQEDVSKEGVTAAAEKKERLKRLSSLFYRRVQFPFIRQHDEMSCGTTCLMMIAKYYGKLFSSSRLRDMAHVDRSGVSLNSLAVAAEQLGFTTRAMRLDYGKLMTVQHPCIVHWEGYHYVVVHKMDEESVWVSDPGIGRRKYEKAFFLDRWNGITLVLEPTPEFEKQAEDRSSIRNFTQFVVPYKVLIAEILAATVLLNLFGLATPIFTQNVVDKVLSHGNVSMLNVMLAGMLLVLVFRFLVTVLREYLIIHVAMKVDLRMLVAFYKHLLALPLDYFKVRKIGDFIARFGENMQIRNFLTKTALTLVLDTVLIVVYLSVMFYYNVKLTWVSLVFIPVYVGVTLGFTPRLRRLNVDSFAARVASESHLIESINGIDTVKAMNTEYPTRWRWEDKFVKSLNIDFSLYKTAIYFDSIGGFVGMLSSTIVLWYGAHQVMQGTLSVGGLMAFMALLGSVIAPIDRLVGSWDDLQQVLVSVDRLNDVLDAKAEFPEKAGDAAGLVLREPRGEVLFKDVYFRYGGDDDPYILSKIDLKIDPGQTVAVVGRSGSGKSTLVKLIPRFYDVTEGRLMIDGHDVKNLHLGNLRQMVGSVLQNNFVFSGTIRENISLWDPDETLDKVVQAAKLANAHDFISSLALGYETKVGESGLQLSGGQKQRLSIAQVLYADPKIIILDEATSSLDTESERAIQKNMSVIMEDRTAIVIAHRLSTVRNADSIVVLDRGEVVEQGTHEQLMEKHGLYHYLAHQQLNL